MVWEGRERRRVLVKERKIWLHESKRGKPCFDCGGVFDPICMDYHHIDPSTKHKGGIPQMIKSGYGIERIQGEIDKCVCLCSNCHRMRHKPDSL